MLHDSLDTISQLPKETLDFQLSPSLSAKNASGVLAAQEAATNAAALSASHKSQIDVVYGKRPRQKLDVFLPQALEGPAPCFVFIHGGFWQEGSKSVSGFAASAFTAAGWAYVSVGYTLTPDVSLSELTAEIIEAVEFLSQNAAKYGINPDKIILCGHSAGGHLTACMLGDVLNTGVASKLAGAVMVSGVFDLDPIAASYVNDLAQITPSEINALSPVRARPKKGVPVLLLIGGDESIAFQAQSEALHRQWQPHLSQIAFLRIPGRDHFDILDDLSDPESESFGLVQDMIRDA